MAGNGAVTRFSVVSPGPPVPSELFSGSSAGAATAFHAKRNAMAAKRNRASGILETHSNGHALFLSQMQRFKEIPHNTAAHLAVPFPTSAACRFLDLPPVNLRNLQLHLSKNSLAS